MAQYRVARLAVINWSFHLRCISLFFAVTVGGCRDAPTVNAKHEVLAITPKEIWDRFHENEIAAEERYAGKLLVVSGTVTGTELEAAGRPIVLLAASDRSFPVRAELTPEAGVKVDSLRSGERRIFKCTGITALAQSPMLLNCTF